MIDLVKPQRGQLRSHMYGELPLYEEARLHAAGMLIKGAESVKVLLPYTLSLGMQTSLTGLTSARIMERKRCDALSHRSRRLQGSISSCCILLSTQI